jgi:hypothetical protein
VWQPREAQSRNWRPYTNGHWVYTDAGWTWMSDEPFGWATYHYGRWTRLRNVGWVWVPGDEWAPAWVSWRKSNDYVGWAPLPPEAQFDRRHGIHNWADSYYDISPDQYVFVQANQVGVQRVDRAAVPSERNVTIINETTNVTNITYTNTTIVNQGPSYDELRSRSEQPIEHYRLERGTTVTGDRPVVRGEVIAMPDPIGAEPAEVGYVRPPTVKERIANAVVETGWSMITDRAAAEQTRKKMKAEATPPADAPSKTYVKPEPASASAATETALAVETAAPAESRTVTATATPTATPTPRPRATSTPPPTVAPTATPSATAAATATPRARRTPSPSPSPVATSPATAVVPSATPAATASPRLRRGPSPSATPAATSAATALSPTPIATPSATPRARHTPSPSPSPAASPSVAATAPTDASPSTTPASELGFTARDAKARDQQTKRDFEAAKREHQRPAEEAKAAEDLKRDAFRRQRQRDATGLEPNPLTTPTSAASSAPAVATSASPAATSPAAIGGGPAKEQPPKRHHLPPEVAPAASPSATPQPSASPAGGDQ